MPIIGFEGLSGVGKTTFARYIARSKGAEFIDRSKLPKGLRKLGPVINNSFDRDRRFNHYIVRNTIQMDIAREISEAGGIAVLDSTIYQTVLTHRVLKSDTAKEYEIPDKLIPDLVIWLDCVESIRQIRVRGENRPPISDWDRALEANQSVLREGFDALHLPKVSTGGSFRQAQRGIHEVIARKLSL